MWGGNMMGWGSDWGMGGVRRRAWPLLVVGVLVLLRWLSGSGRGVGDPDNSRSVGILKERYARGQIDKAEFDARRRDLD